MTRRQLLISAMAGSAIFAFPGWVLGRNEAAPPIFKLPPLPYPQNALEPFISGRTVSFHYGKHHKNYVDKLNLLVEGTPFAQQSLEEIIKATFDDKRGRSIFNNAAQVYNHTLYWNSMSPNGGGTPKGELAQQIDSSFGGFEDFKNEFSKAANSQFGSGYAWLVSDNGRLRIIKTSNAVNPIVYGQKPILTIDVWEHAYYLDYQNRRGEYVTAYLDHLVNWEFARKNLSV